VVTTGGRCNFFKLGLRSSSKIYESGSSMMQYFWLHAMCECPEWYFTYQIRWENWWL